jgi:hypothetical protein
MDNAIAEAIHQFIAFGHLEGGKESVIAAGDRVGSDNHFLTTDSHNLSVHFAEYFNS